jgi:MFS family permease
MADEEPTAPRKAELWRHRDFLHLWAAQSVSEFGSQITLLALPLAAILVLGSTAFQVAALTTIEYLPFVLFSPLAGVLVDRHHRRSVLIGAHIGRGAALASVPLAYAFDALTLTQLYFVGFLHGGLTLFFGIAYQGYLPSLVQREQLIEANVKSEVTQTAAQLSGPAAAGGLVALLSAPVAILADAISFFVAAVLIGRIRFREPPLRSDVGQQRSLRRELREGGSYVLRNSYLRPLMMATGLINFSVSVVVAILLVFAVRELDLSPGVIGVILSIGEVGGLVAAASYRRLRRRIGVGPTVVLAAMILGPSTLVIALAPKVSAVPFLLAGWAAASFSRVVYNVSATSIRQALVPSNLQGRATGFIRWVAIGTVPLGSFAGGALAATIGLRGAMVVGAGLSFLVLLPVILSPIRGLRDLPMAPT